MLKDVYNVELVDRSFGSCGYNAAKKPRLDSSKTLLDNMGHLIPIYVLSDASKNRLFNGIYSSGQYSFFYLWLLSEVFKNKG